MRIVDAQQALGFLTSQTAHIEPQVYEIQYPDIQYPFLIPVDTSANEWAKSVTFFSTDKVGQAKWFSGSAKDMPRADVFRAKYDQGIEMAAIGYGYNIEELGQAMLVPGTNLTTDRAAASRRAYEEFVEGVALSGDANKNMKGLINYTGVSAASVAADGTGSSTLWANKTADLILRDINDGITGVYTASNTVELADTVLLPIARLTKLATMRVGDTTMTVAEYLAKNNVYTQITGKPLTIRGMRGLDTAGAGSTARMIIYRRSIDVLKLHLPMPHRFLPVWQTGPLEFEIPGIFRLGGVEIRRPGAVRYLDGI
jgi:hypothetical protein